MNLASADKNSRKSFDQLTSREIDVLSCLIENQASKKIGPILGITEKAVDTHISNISQKLEKYGRANIVDYTKKSIDISEFRKRYCHLANTFEFYKILKKIKQQFAGQSITCKISCKDKALKKQIVSDLKTLNITCFERKKEIQAIQIQPRDNYYQMFFEILYQLVPHPLIEEAVECFANKKQVDDLGLKSELKSIRSKNLHYQRNLYFTFLNYVKRYKHLFSIFSILCCVIFGVNTYFLAAIPPIRSNLPIPIDVYRLDRSYLMAEISSKFKGTQGIQTVVIVGMGGMGKTILTHQYARTQSFPIVWEINAENQGSILSSFEQLAFAMAKTIEEKNETDRIKKIANEQEYRSRLLRFVQQKLVLQKQWLLIFDNVDNLSDIQSFFPNDTHTWGNGRILITTRNDHIKYNEHIKAQNVINITPLNLTEQTILFSKIVSKKHDFTETPNKDLEGFLKQIPPFPLDIVLAAQYIRNTGISYNDYLQKMSTENDDFEKSQSVLAKEMTSYAKTRYSIVACTMKHLMKDHPEFIELLLLICSVGSQNIPQDLLLSCKEASIVEEFIAQMRRCSLLEHTVGSGQQLSSISTHRSIQQKLSIYLNNILENNDKNKYFDSITDVLDRYCSAMIEESDVLKMKSFVYHVLIFLEKTNELNLENRGNIKALHGYMHFLCFNTLQAKEYIKDSLDFLPTSHPRRLRTMIYTGIVERHCGNYQKAKDLLQKSVQLYESTSLSNELDLALALRNLSSTYRFMAEFDKAKIAIDRSIDIYTKYEKKSDLSRAFLDLAFLYHYGANDETKSLDYLSRSLSKFEELHGPHHLETLWIRGTRGFLLHQIGRYKEAYQEIKISYDGCMNKHSYAISQNNWIMGEMGSVYLTLGCYKKAKLLLERSLERERKYYGAYLAMRASLFVDVGRFYWETGNYQKAKESLETSLQTTRETLGEDHWRICWILHYLALVYASLGDNKKAQALFEKCFDLYKKKYQYKRIERAIVLRDFGQFHTDKHDYVEAEKLIREALKILSEKKHPECYKCFEYLGNLYMAKGQRNNADYAYMKALSIAKIHFPKDSDHIARLKSKIPFMRRCILFINKSNIKYLI